jgi:hypothetical protein
MPYREPLTGEPLTVSVVRIRFAVAGFPPLIAARLREVVQAGKSSEALVAGPPAPEYPAIPFPATTVRVPSAATRKTMLLLLSAT